MTDYLSLIQSLQSKARYCGKEGLNQMFRLCNLLGNPERLFPSIHITGTNGKGSVTTKIAKSFEATGLRVGLYTSPHISCFRERIQINGIKIPEEFCRKALKDLFDIAKDHHMMELFFELTTCLAFLYFAAEKVDIAVLEVGIGGLVDATNVITPRLSVITSVSMDHADTLGNTIEAITYEKSGIIKPSVPIVIGPRVPRHIVEEVATANNSPLYQVLGNFPTFNEENNAVARKALSLLNVDPEAIEKGVAILPPCRIQYFPDQHVVVDVAHNPDGITQLLKSLRQHPWGKGPLHVVCGLSKSKDIQQCLTVLHNHVERIYFVEGTSNRAMPAEELMQQSAAQGFFATSSHTSIKDGFEQAMANRKDKDTLIIVCGTFFIMDEALTAIHAHTPT